jgi:Uma2 family endonuclease
MSALPAHPRKIFYPDSDGLPMSDNTLQYKWIAAIAHGLDVMFLDWADVFVAGDLLWYPVEGHPEIRVGPDVLVAFGRPKGDRGSYKQWAEGGIAPQVVFEVLSPGNRFQQMRDKFEFYQRYGVEEYYIYNPDANELEGYRRAGSALVPVPDFSTWVSPRLGIRFHLAGQELRILRPDGRPFLTYQEILELEPQLLAERKTAERERRRAERERQRAEQERLRAEQERLRAEQAERGQTDALDQIERLKALLRERGLNPEN